MGSLIAPKGGKEFERQLVPIGLQEVVCYSVVDLWGQEITREWESKLQRKVMITFETKEMGIFKNKDTLEGVEKPLIIGNRYTLSMHEKSWLHKVLKSRLGKAPSEDFDIMSMVWKSALINVIETEWKNGKTYHNIDSILPSKEAPFKTVNEEVRFSLQNFERKEFEKLHQWMQDLVITTKEYQESQEELPFR